MRTNERRWSPALQGIAIGVLLLILTIFVYGDVLFSRGILFGQDIIELGYPLAYFRHISTLQDQPPIWNPYMMCGYPQMSSAPFLPVDAIDRFVGMSKVSVVRYMFHTFMAGLLMYFLLRRFRLKRSVSMLGGVTFMFSAFFMSKVYAGHGGAFSSGVWIPLIFICVDRLIETRRFRDALLVGAAVGLQVLGEHLQYVFYTLLAVLPYVVYRLRIDCINRRQPGVVLRYAALVVLAAGFAFMTSAIFILPFREMAMLSNRAGGTSYEYATSLSLPPANLLTALIPNILGSPVSNTTVYGAIYWDAALYIGVIPLLLMLIAFRWSKDGTARFFKWLAAGAIILALGNYTPLYKIIYHIPGFSMIRAPSKMLYIYTFAASILAAYGMDILRQNIGPGRSTAVSGWLSPESRSIQRMVRIYGSICVGAFAVMLITRPAVLYVGRILIQHTRDHPEKYIHKLDSLFRTQIGSMAVTAVFAIIAFVVIQGMFRRRISTVTGTAILIACVFMDLMFYANPLIRPVDPNVYYSFNKKEVAFLKQDQDVYRILPLSPTAFRFNQGVVAGIESINGYYPVITKRYGVLAHAIDHKTDQLDVSIQIKNYRSKLIDLFNVKYILSKRKISGPDIMLVHPGRIKIYINSGVLPRAFLLRKVQSARTEDEALRMVTSASFEPSKALVLNTGAKSLPEPPKDTTESVRFITRKPNEMTLTVNAASPAYLFMSYQYDPRWKTYIDGKPAEMLLANYAFRAVKVPAGRHTVSMINDPASRKWGFYSTLLAYLIIAGVMMSMWLEAVSARAREELKVKNTRAEVNDPVPGPG